MTSGTVSSDKQNFIGNEVPNTGFLMGNYILAGTEHFEYGNNIRGTITPAGTNNLPDSSYYLNDKPFFWAAQPFPSIGSPNVLNSGSIPAKDRFAAGKYSVCSSEIITTMDQQQGMKGFKIYPVPALNKLTVEFPMGSYRILIRDAIGREIFSTDVFNAEGLATELPEKIPAGIYTILIHSERQTFRQQFTITK
jgi:hypothetical protein